jgi:translation initiation factor IF-2
MKVDQLAKNVGVSAEELIEILQDIDISVEEADFVLTDEQIAAVCDELGYASLEEAQADNETSEPVVTPEEEPSHSVVEDAVVEPELEGDEPSDVPPEDEQASLIELKKPKVMVKDFAEMLDLKPNMLIAELMRMNVFASINAEIDLNVAKKIGEKHGFTVRKEEKKRPAVKPVTSARKVVAKRMEEMVEDTPESMMPRSPVVTFMGHVDHGKTSLLDRIRNSRVVTGEAGGITQHIGAYTVDVNDSKITFLDTPGHAAFTAMRARGANMTDVVVLVVAADDGVMPQTLEALKHAQAAEVCIIIAMNKMDLRTANPDRVKQQLQENDIMVEEWGGSIGCCPVSAATGEGMDGLLERILLESEMLELKANPKRPAQGFVVEAQMEPGMGPTASVIVKSGTLRMGDSVICGKYWGRVKALINDQGVKVRSAGPSMAVKILGLTNVPGAGDEFEVLSSDREAKQLAEAIQDEERQLALEGGATPKKMSLDDLFGSAGSQEEKKELRLIIKADVQGSSEAIAHSLSGIKSDKVELKILANEVGNVTVNDVMLASASDAIILGFHSGKENGTNAAAKREGVEIRLYSIIYELIENVENAMKGLLEPELREQVIGEAEILEVFEFSKKSKIAGCMIQSGRVTVKANIRIKRQKELIYEGAIGSLKRFQNDAAEVRQGQECGIRPDHFVGFEVGDIIEAYLVEKISQNL